MIATIIVCATLVFLAERFRPLAIRLIAQRESLETTGTPAGIPPLPLDLQAQVDRCSESWERSDLLGAIREHFLSARPLVESDDDAWIAVRRRLRPEEAA